jgi:hypothetical protein
MTKLIKTSPTELGQELAKIEFSLNYNNGREDFTILLLRLTSLQKIIADKISGRERPEPNSQRHGHPCDSPIRSHSSCLSAE